MTLDRQITGLVDAAITAKWEHIEVSRALHEPLADIGGTQLVTASAVKTAGTVAEVLRSCADASFRDVDRLSLLLVISCSALLQAAVTDETGALDREAVAHAYARNGIRLSARNARRPIAGSGRMNTSRRAAALLTLGFVGLAGLGRAGFAADDDAHRLLLRLFAGAVARRQSPPHHALDFR